MNRATRRKQDKTEKDSVRFGDAFPGAADLSSEINDFLNEKNVGMEARAAAMLLVITSMIMNDGGDPVEMYEKIVDLFKQILDRAVTFSDSNRTVN